MFGLVPQVAPVAAAQVAVRTERMNVLTAQVNGGELVTRIHRDAKGRFGRCTYFYQGKRIERAHAMRLPAQPRTVFRHG